MAKQNLFFKTENGVKSINTVTSLINSGGHTVALNSTGGVVIHDNSSTSGKAFDDLKSALKGKTNKKSSLALNDGGFIDINIIAEAFISPKSGSLLITSIKDGNLIYLFDSEEYPNLTGLRDVLANTLTEFDGTSALKAIDWASFQ